MSLRQSALHSNQPAFGHFMTQKSQKKKKRRREKGKFGGFKYLTYVQVMAHLKQGSHNHSYVIRSTSLLPEVVHLLFTPQ